MPTAVETTISAFACIAQVVPIGTNVSLLRILWVMGNGDCLSSRGALHPALLPTGFSEKEVRRSWSALRYGSWTIAELLESWHMQVAATNEWDERRHGGYPSRASWRIRIPIAHDLLWRVAQPRDR